MLYLSDNTHTHTLNESHCVFQVTCQLCSGPCQCPLSPLTCPLGVPLVLDGCRCCQICAGQEGELCSEKDMCDAQRGLECDYSASFPDGPGECVHNNRMLTKLTKLRRSSHHCSCSSVENMADCVQHAQGRSYANRAESWGRACSNCRQLCRCVGGGVTCVPLCTEDLNTPNCQHPRLVHVPGRCCRKWVCDSKENSIVPENTAGIQTHEILLFKDIYIFAVMVAERAMRSWQDTSAPSRISWTNCIEQSTEWSVCSRSCGPGVSTRVSNRNLPCQPETRMRLCVVRPCHPGPTARAQPKPGVCQSSYRSPVLVHFEHQGCYSARSYRPLFCGMCSDGRCCSPDHTRTALVTFRCRKVTRTTRSARRHDDRVVRLPLRLPSSEQLQKNKIVAVDFNTLIFRDQLKLWQPFAFTLGDQAVFDMELPGNQHCIKVFSHLVEPEDLLLDHSFSEHEGCGTFLSQYVLQFLSTPGNGTKADPDLDSPPRRPQPVRRKEPAVSEAPLHDEAARPTPLYPNLSKLSHQPPPNCTPAILSSPVALHTRSQVKGPTTLLPEGFRPTKSDREGTVHTVWDDGVNARYRAQIAALQQRLTNTFSVRMDMTKIAKCKQQDSETVSQYLSRLTEIHDANSGLEKPNALADGQITWDTGSLTQVERYAIHTEKLLREAKERKMERRRKPKGHGRGRPGGNPHRYNFTCFISGKVGHVERDCPEQKPTDGKRKGRVRHLGTEEKPGVCQSSYRSPVLVHFEHQGCYSARSYRPLFCGMCSDGRCCSPDHTRTALVTFRCPRKRFAQHAVMMIESYVCYYDCPHPNSSRRTRLWLSRCGRRSYEREV
ncbi:uncharacterized protein LOC128624692 [Ictalurus furcatus]|uniref:uncharacterized protein LOC128624692 n=1 Tax=Ictalurus furcatus TaxID=66913 RepID=UPI00234FC0A7|nr:uncharacterized protein LOC128624692 [Ictalurus furcatus]